LAIYELQGLPETKARGLRLGRPHERTRGGIPRRLTVSWPRMETRPRGQLSVIVPPSVPTYTSLRRRRDAMKWRDFLPIPKKYRRRRSKARSEVGSNEDRGEAGPVALRPTESTPDLGVSASILPKPTPLTPHGHGSDGMWMISPLTIALIACFRAT
jgi:hypothetical protein